MKEKALELVKELSHKDLQDTLKKLGQTIPVNVFTRGMVEKGIAGKLNEYSDNDIRLFLDDNFSGWDSEESV